MPLLGITQAPFEDAVRNELPTLYRVAKRLCGNAEMTEDLVQQTLINAFRSYKRFDGRHFRSWLVRILRNEFYSQYRKADHDINEELEETSASVGPFWAEVESRVLAEQILSEVEKLPVAFRLTLHLCDIEELSYEEVAEIMEVPVGTVRSRLFRARAALRRKLGHQMTDGESRA